MFLSILECIMLSFVKVTLTYRSLKSASYAESYGDLFKSWVFNKDKKTETWNEEDYADDYFICQIVYHGTSIRCKLLKLLLWRSKWTRHVLNEHSLLDHSSWALTMLH